MPKLHLQTANGLSDRAFKAEKKPFRRRAVGLHLKLLVFESSDQSKQIKEQIENVEVHANRSHDVVKSCISDSLRADEYCYQHVITRAPGNSHIAGNEEPLVKRRCGSLWRSFSPV